MKKFNEKQIIIKNYLSKINFADISPQNLFNIICAAEGIKRFKLAPKEKKQLQELENFIEGLNLNKPQIKKIIEVPQIKRWEKDFRKQLDFYEHKLGLTSTKEEETRFAVRAEKLFFEADEWRLGLIGIIKRFDHTKAEEILSLLENGPITQILNKPFLFADVAPKANNILSYFKDDLLEKELLLGSTIDIYEVVRGVIDSVEVYDNGFIDFLKTFVPKNKIAFPVHRPAAAASAFVSHYKLSFVWQSPDKIAKAYMVFISDTKRKEAKNKIKLKIIQLIDSKLNWKNADELILFGIKNKIKNGESEFLQEDIRKAGQEFVGSSLLIKNPLKKTWEIWRMIAPYTED